VLEGTLCGACYPRHPNGEFRPLPQNPDWNLPTALDLHLIVDNCGMYTHPKLQRWLAKHPRLHLHSTPTRSLWLILAERWLWELTVTRLRRGVFKRVLDLITVIEGNIQFHNAK